ncbi:MAG: ABC transporter ATP-binding protein [Vicinamibacteria bacterium]|jgi:ABC-2 type transport system ATP-binding protein|nr:ABC transporter ATP-binding protein [Vicinamibacteria bacterium]MBP9947199.1 ABC transporter ATP-binding protein [Vicinamibacteria bacterium]
MSSLAIEARHLVKTYKNKAAVRDLSLAVRPGVLYAFLGPNGAGKSTTLRMLTGLLKPTSGDVLILGQSIDQDPMAVKASIGLVPDDLPLFDRLTGEETLLFIGRIHGLATAEARRRSEELLDYFDLAEARAQAVMEYSLGMKKKLALAAALIHKPRVLFLDEALNGVDPVSVKSIADLLRALVASGLTIFFTTHVLDVAERLCDEIGVIHEGKLVASGTLDDIRRLRQMGADARLEDVFLQVVGAEKPKLPPSFLGA